MRTDGGRKEKPCHGDFGDLSFSVSTNGGQWKTMGKEKENRAMEILVTSVSPSQLVEAMETDGR